MPDLVRIGSETAKGGFANERAIAQKFRDWKTDKEARKWLEMKEVSADKAYSSRDNLNVVGQIGGVAYIPFKSNAAGNPRGKGRLWRNMFYYFQMHQEDFMTHYHKRSNVETTNMAIKTKLGDCLKNKNFVSQTNELLCKLIAYNITVLIGAIYELKIEPNLVFP